MHYILCKENHWIKTLQKELTADYTKDCRIVEGLPLIKIPASVDLRGGYLAFSSTALINAQEIPGAPVSKQANSIMELMLPKIDEGAKINYHVFALTDKYGILETGRAEIFKEKIRSGLRKKKVTCLKKGFDRSLPFLQVLILADRSIAVSFLSEEEMAQYYSLISPFVGGFNNVGDDKKAPSRAFKKIVEAQELLGTKISEGELLVDLGACPGGWSYIARKNGARVIALDRSPLSSELMDDKQVQFIKADAFQYQPTMEIDWVVSDIIAAPERILELVDYWVFGKKCKYFIFTIKFQGHKDYGLLKKFKKAGKECEYNVILKQLNANKNEVTIMGSRI